MAFSAAELYTALATTFSASQRYDFADTFSNTLYKATAITTIAEQNKVTATTISTAEPLEITDE